MRNLCITYDNYIVIGNIYRLSVIYIVSCETIVYYRNTYITNVGIYIPMSSYIYVGVV